MDNNMMDVYGFDQLPYSFHESPTEYLSIRPQTLLDDSTISIANALPAVDQSLAFVQTPYYGMFQTQSNTQHQDPVQSADVAPPAKSRKRKAPTLREQDWAPYKARVMELHIDQNKPLAEVKAELVKLGFTAEIRQYKSILEKWGVGKKIKKQEMQAIVRKQRYRQLEEVDKGELTFTVRGSEVEGRKIARWIKEKGIPEDAPYAPSPDAPTPSDVSCRTLSDRGTPAPNPLFSARNPIPPMSPPSAYERQVTSSPASSTISSILRSSPSTFTGQSPAMTHRNLPSSVQYPLRTSSSPAVPTANYWDQTPGLEHITSLPVKAPPLRYLQAEEDRLNEELTRLELLHDIDHPATFETLRELGDVLGNQGRYKSAETIFQRLIRASRKEYGDNDIITLVAMGRLGQVYKEQGEHVHAENIVRQNFLALKSLCGLRDDRTLYCMGELVSVLVSQEKAEKWDEGATLTMQMIEHRKALNGPEAPRTLMSILDLAQIYNKQGRTMKAEELARYVLNVQSRVPGWNHWETTKSMSILATSLAGQQRHGEAVSWILQVKDIRESLLGPEHPLTLVTMQSLSICWRGQGRIGDAVEMMADCLRLRRKVLGDGHPLTMTSFASLSAWKMEMSMLPPQTLWVQS